MEFKNEINEGYNLDNYLKDLNLQDLLKNIPNDNECQLRVSLTQLCNESCFFCHNEGNPKSKVCFNDTIFKKSIDTMVKYGIKQKVRFTGGEPLLYNGITDLIKYVKEKSPEINVGLTTNALLLEEKAESLINAGLDKITISLHSLKKEGYKKITKVDGLDVVIKGLEKLRNLGFKGDISINSVIGTNNIEEVCDLDLFCKINGFKLKLLDILPVTHDLKKYTLTQSQIEKLTKINKVKGIRTQEKCINCPEKKICGGEAEYLRMSPDGILNPCLSLKKFDIDLNSIKLENNFEKGFLLGLSRIKSLLI